MHTYIVSCDLDASAHKYKIFSHKIREYPNWTRITFSCWCIRTNKSAPTLCSELREVLDHNDSLFVAELAREATWFNLPEEVTKWLKNNY